MILPLVPSSDPILKEVMPDFDFQAPSTDPVELAVNLTETMISSKGLGLAANQIGVRARAFAMMTNPVFVCFNPRIVDVSEEQVALEEGCLTFPKVFLTIKRPRFIKVRFTLPNGETRTEKFHDMTARIFQHELDHLNGVLFTTKVSRLVLNIATRKANKR